MYGRTRLLNSSIDLHVCTFLRGRHSCCKIAIGTSLRFPFAYLANKRRKVVLSPDFVNHRQTASDEAGIRVQQSDRSPHHFCAGRTKAFKSLSLRCPCRLPSVLVSIAGRAQVPLPLQKTRLIVVGCRSQPEVFSRGLPGPSQERHLL
jgi:hypothetical protein